MDKNFFYATATLIGTIVGAGMFGIPYVVAQSGFWIGAIFLLVLTGITLLIHLIYGEIVCRTQEKRRLVGYAQYYLGENAKKIVTLAVLFGFYGALTAYVIIGGDFLSTIFSPIFGGNPFIYSLIFFVFGAIFILKDLSLIKKAELIMSLFLVVIIFVIFFSSLPHIQSLNFKGINIAYLFLPYGVILWSLAGGSAIPEIKDLFGDKGKYYKKAIIFGTLIPAILYLFFVLAVVGVNGNLSSQDAISGLIGVLGRGIILLGAILGILAVATSFFTIGISLKKVFHYDYKINKELSWILVCLVPLVCFLLGLRQFILIIGFLGVIMGAIEGTAIILIYKKAKKIGNRKPEYSLHLPSSVLYGLIGIFILGLVYQIIHFL